MEEDAHSDIEIEQDWPMHPFTTDAKFAAAAFHQDNERTSAGLAPTSASVSDAAPRTRSPAPPDISDRPLPSSTTLTNPLDDDFDGNNANIELDLSSHDGDNRKEEKKDAPNAESNKGRVILLEQQGTAARTADAEAAAAGQERETNGGWMGSIVKKCRRLVSGLCSGR